MKIFLYYSLLFFLFFFSAFCFAQVKYISHNKNAAMFSFAYSKPDAAEIFSGQINYSKDGRAGIGILYQRGSNPRADGIGIQIEYAVYKPVNKTAPGINLFGTVAGSRTSITYFREYGSPLRIDNADGYYYKSLVYSRSASIGAELYLYVPENIFRFEPFLQLSRTYGIIDYTNEPVSYTHNSLGIGTDMILSAFNNSLFICTIGEIFQGKSNAFLVNLSFVRLINN